MALRRELREELSIDNVTLSDSPLLTYEDGELRLTAWQVHSWTGQIRNDAPDEHDAIGWFSADEVHTMNLATAAYLPLLARLTA